MHFVLNSVQPLRFFAGLLGNNTGEVKTEQEIGLWHRVHGANKCRKNAEIKEIILCGVRHYSCPGCRKIIVRDFTSDEKIAIEMIRHKINCDGDLPPHIIQLSGMSQRFLKCRCCDRLANIPAFTEIEILDDQPGTN